MKGTGTAAGIGAHAPRPPQTLDDRSGAVNASRHGRTAATAASRHATALFEPVPRRRRHRSGRLIRLMRLDPGPQRRIAQLQHLEQAQRAQGGQGLCDVAPGGLAALPRGGGVAPGARIRQNAPTVPLRTITPWNSPWFTSSGSTSCAFISAPCRAGRRDGARCGHWRYDRRVAPARLAYSGHSIPHSCQRRLRPLPARSRPGAFPRGPRAIAVRRDDAELRDTAMHRHARGQLLGARRG